MMKCRVSVKGGKPVPMSLEVQGGEPVPMRLSVARSVVPARDYNDLINKPSIEGHTLVGDSMLPEIGVHDITGIDFQVVATLPASGVKGTIYLVGTAAPYDEYIWIEPTGGTAFWEKIGSTDVDLTDYWTSQSGQTNSLIAITTAQIDALFA